MNEYIFVSVRTILFFVGSILLAALLVRCTMELEETYFAEVKKNKPNFSITLNEFLDDDTLWVNQPSSIAFTVTTTAGVVRQTEVLLNDRVIYSTASSIGKFEIAGADLRTGFFQLTVRFMASAGTGSLADRLGAEGNIVWRTWVLAIDITPPTPAVLQRSEQDGYFKLTWQPYRRKNFQKYVVYVRRMQSWGNVFDYEVYEIKDYNQTSFIDSSNTGGSRHIYSVATHTPLESRVSDDLVEENPIGLIVDRHPEDTTLVFRWNKPRYPAAVESYVLAGFFQSDELVDFIPANDTAIRVKIKAAVFALNRYYSFSVKAKTISRHFLLSQPNVLDPIGTAIKPNQQFFYSAGLKAWVGYTKGQGVLRLYDGNLALRDSIEVLPDFKVPFPGNHLFSPTSGGIMHVDLVARKSTLLPYHPSHANQGIPYFFSGSNSLHYSYTAFGPHGVVEALMDGKTGKLIGEWKPNSLYDMTAAMVSPSGKYFSKSWKIYQTYPDTTFTGTYYYNEIFRPDNDDELLTLMLGVKRLKIGDPASATWLRLPNFYGTSSYDPFSKNILSRSESSFDRYLMNIESGLVKKIAVHDPQSQVLLVNGLLIHPTSGLCVRVL